MSCEELVIWANKIDSAAYTSVQEAILGQDPALRINSSLLVDADRPYCEFLVQAISREGLTATSQHRNVSRRAEKAHAKIMRGLAIAEKTTRLEGDVAVLTFEETPDAVISRYAPYMFFPDARYSVLMFHSASSTKLTAMRNPWLQFEGIPLGPLFAQFGGGGHDRVASVEFRSGQRTDDDILAMVLRRLQGHEVRHQREVFA